MIGKAKSISHAANSIDYAREKPQAEELGRYLLAGDTGQEIAREFQIFQEMNDRCDNNTISIVVSPQIEDGKQLSNEQLQEITRRMLSEMQLNDRQYIAYVHHEKEHKHIHLYVNRIDTKGEAYKDNFIGKKASKAAEKIAKALGLTTAMEVKEQKQEGTKALRSAIKQFSDKVLESQPKSIEAFVQAMNEKGKEQLKTEAYYNKQGEFQGVRFYVNDQKFKASEVHRSLGKKSLLQSIENGKKQTKSTGITRGISERDRGTKRGHGFGR